MNIDTFKELFIKKMRRTDYETRENEWHVKQLCYCRHKMMNQGVEEVMKKEPVIIGVAVDRLVKDVLGGAEPIKREVGKYTVIGTPDLVIDDKVIDVKFAMFPKKKASDHDLMQVKMYLWLLDVDEGYLWYISPQGSAEYRVFPSYVDEDIIRIIENPKYPLWSWECKFCSLYPCEHRLYPNKGAPWLKNGR